MGDVALILEEPLQILGDGALKVVLPVVVDVVAKFHSNILSANEQHANPFYIKLHK